MSYSVQSSKELMEGLVEDYLNRWRIYHPNPDTDNFVTTKNQEEIIQYIMKNMVLEMTDTIRSQLSIAYKVGTDEELVAKEVSIYITIDGDIVYRFNSNFKKKTAKQLNELFDEIVTRIGIAISLIIIFTTENIKPIDVYRGKTELKITETKSDELNVKLTATEEFTI